MAARQSGGSTYPSLAVNPSTPLPSGPASTQQPQSYNGESTHRGQLNLPVSQTTSSRSHPPSPLGQPPMLARQPSTAELSSLLDSNTDPNMVPPHLLKRCYRYTGGFYTDGVRDLAFTREELEDTDLDAEDHAILKKKQQLKSVSMKSLRRVQSNLRAASLFGRSSLRVNAQSTQSQLSVNEISPDIMPQDTDGQLEHSDYYQNQTPSSGMQLSAINRNSTDSQEVRIPIIMCAAEAWIT
jgi:hypothetical protein